MSHKVVLCILDGWGYSKRTEHNPLYRAHTPTLDMLLSDYPLSLLGASGESVGLCDGQMGNSEVGHITIGSGRVIEQSLLRISKKIDKDGFFDNALLLKHLSPLCRDKSGDSEGAGTSGAVVHILGLCSDGGVHSHIDHIIALIRSCARCNNMIKTIHLHMILDGRDTLPESAVGYIQQIIKAKEECNAYSQCKIVVSTISGRYYAMDRDKRYDRTKMSVNAILRSENCDKVFDEEKVVDYVELAYSDGVTDEFVLPARSSSYSGVSEGDILLVANFRADRMVQILKELTVVENAFSGVISMTHYSDKLAKNMSILFPQQVVKNTLGEVLQNHKKTQLRAAETEKYAHVTFFFNGGLEDNFVGEDRLLIDSPKVASYDLQPEMSAYELTDGVVKRIKTGVYDFVCVNFANLDMVGHTGSMDAAIRACEAVDSCLSDIVDCINGCGGGDEYKLLLTADHGNIEEMYSEEKRSKLTAHTTNPVPCVYYDPQCGAAKNGDDGVGGGGDVGRILRASGGLCDISPTVLDIMGIKQPEEMSGSSLLRLLE